MATNQKRAAQYLGFTPLSTSSTVTLALNAAATWLSFDFVPDASKTINTVRVYCSAVAGTLGANALSADVYSDTSGAPNASLGSTTTVTGGQPTGAGIVEFTGLSIALTGGTQYHVVLKNNDATPATNNPTYRWCNASMPPATQGVAGKYGWGKQHTTNSGGAWGTTQSGTAVLRVGYSDGSYQGFPATNISVGADKAFGAAALNQWGVKFTTPPNGVLNVRRGALIATAQGAVTGDLVFKLWNNTTLLASAIAIPVANASGSGWYEAEFSANQVIQPGTVLRLSASNSNTDSSAIYYRCPNEFTIDGDSNSLPLYPFEGTAQKTITANSGSTWTDTNTALLPFAIGLDSDGEFGSSGGGSGMIVHPGMAGGMRG